MHSWVASGLLIIRLLFFFDLDILKHMPCTCVNTAILLEDENEYLRKVIADLKNTVKQYQLELIKLYRETDESIEYMSQSSSGYTSPDTSESTSTISISV
jgi:hypothetical protein